MTFAVAFSPGVGYSWLLLANFLKNGGRVLRRELLAGGMSKWTYDEAKKRLDDVGAKGKDAVMARHSPKAADSEPGDGHDAPSDEVVPRSMRADRGRRAARKPGNRKRGQRRT